MNFTKEAYSFSLVVLENVLRHEMIVRYGLYDMDFNHGMDMDRVWSQPTLQS